jgi:hypothetical protein
MGFQRIRAGRDHHGKIKRREWTSTHIPIASRRKHKKYQEASKRVDFCSFFDVFVGLIAISNI